MIPPSRSRKTGALVAQQPQLRAAVGGRAVVGHLQEEIVREVGGVGHDERVGGEELRRGDRARARHVAADHAARRHSAARGREGAVQALAVQRARGGRPGDRQRGARERFGGCEASRLLRPRPSMSQWTRRPPW